MSYTWRGSNSTGGTKSGESAFTLVLHHTLFSRFRTRRLDMSPNRTFSDIRELHELSLRPDSHSSTGTASPTLLNPETPDVCSSVGSSHGTPTVKFAPLPQTDPSRKRCLAPLGVPARSRRTRQDAGTFIWYDPDMPEEAVEDPLVTLAKFVKKTGRTLWRRVRKGSKPAAAEAEVLHSLEPVLDIRPPLAHEIEAPGEEGEEMPERRASWSPADRRRTLSLEELQRRRTSDLVP